ncbi:MAG TPA: dipeptide ABC transporter ATP-binding protein [Planctomycetes bacterium]|nr:dipeptide ABC transporter ATP-binding protein [Planctomycetota bacterium]HIL36805.1 dipeptide ABC transporter ATP-binding protein [Planctomycetota bacterium]
MSDLVNSGNANAPLLEVRGLKKYFPVRKGLFSRVVGQVKAVDGLDFTLGRGETMSLVGESGCGKTTAGRTLLRLLAPTAGQVLYSPNPEAAPTDIFKLPAAEMRALRPDLQIIFQDPYASLNPRMTVGNAIAEPLLVHKVVSASEVEDRVAGLLERVGLRPDVANRFPHEFSGGQRQRVGIARALALGPKLIICDEAVSALDVSIQAQVINLLKDLQDEFGISYIFIAHDLSVVRYISDSVAVMYLGRIVESGTAQQIFDDPQHPYTRALLSAIPHADPSKRGERIPMTGEIPSPIHPPSGCHFHTRCALAEDRCRSEWPASVALGAGHQAACHLVQSAGTEEA